LTKEKLVGGIQAAHKPSEKGPILYVARGRDLEPFGELMLRQHWDILKVTRLRAI
jgi:hypothetical protein